jgi:hypothetical protein
MRCASMVISRHGVQHFSRAARETRDEVVLAGLSLPTSDPACSRPPQRTRAAPRPRAPCSGGVTMVRHLRPREDFALGSVRPLCSRGDPALGSVRRRCSREDFALGSVRRPCSRGDPALSPVRHLYSCENFVLGPVRRLYPREDFALRPVRRLYPHEDFALRPVRQQNPRCRVHFRPVPTHDIGHLVSKIPSLHLGCVIALAIHVHPERMRSWSPSPSCPALTWPRPVGTL